MLRLITEVTSITNENSIPIGGQIWMFDDKIKIEDFKYVANIVGK